MDKYWVFIVPAYGTTAVVLIGYVVYLYKRLKDTQNTEERDEP